MSDSDSMRRADHQYMQQALTCAQQALTTSRPNPRVGCVIVIDNQVVAEGYTQPVGQAHAEVQAIAHARKNGITDFSTATFYVTLEPCSHYGKTPPCVEAIIRLQPQRVVIAMQDPNPLVKGQGIAQLRAAGIAVTVGVCVEEALALNIGFVHRMLFQRPWARLKVATSLDGRTALENGQSQWITQQTTRLDGHLLRARSCAILTGIGTVLADDPQFTVRHPLIATQPALYVLDSQLRLPKTARVLDHPNLHLVTTSQDASSLAAIQQKGAQVHVLPAASNGRIELSAVMHLLATHQVNELHIEAGTELIGALYTAGLIDEMVQYISPIFLGSGKGVATIPALDSVPTQRNYTTTTVECIHNSPEVDEVKLTFRQIHHWQQCLQAVEE